VGIATACFSEFGVLTFVGLFWILVGGGNVLLASRKKTPPADLQKKSPASSRSAAVVWMALGIATLWFSGMRFGGSPAAFAQPTEAGSPLAELVTEHVEKEFKRNGHVGIVVAAVSNDDEALLGFGRRNVGSSLPPDADTVFEIGSITKTFTGTLLAQHIERGELKLDDRVGKFLPKGWPLSEAAREVTLEHLTTHTSGLPRLPDNLLGLTRVAGMAFGGDPYRSYSEAEFREALASMELNFEPGSAREYSNFGVGLLGFALATHNGTDYETLLKREICQPLGMDRTVITNTPWHDEHLAPGYRGTLQAGPAAVAMESSPWQLPNHLAGAGGIRSTGNDMLKYLKANMGRLPSPLDAAIRRSHQELYQEYPGRAMGMNWIRSTGFSTAQTILWHNGGTGGYKSYLGFTEDGQYGVVVLSNSSTSVDELGQGIVEALARKFGDVKPVTQDGYAKVAPFTGVRWENDRPIVRVDNHWRPLVSINGLPIDRIMAFAEQEFEDKARKRFAEDLVELLSKMGHDPDWEVTLGLETESGQVERVKVEMTEDNRDLVRD
jgi:CubicO group peptidase (beta-lactamase class C family)